MARILILCSTVDGHTRKICRRLQAVVESNGHHAVVAMVDEAFDWNLRAFDALVIGASIRYGKHRPCVREFIRLHAAALEALPGAFFSVNIVARKPEKNRPDTNPYVQKFLRQVDWRPAALEVFAGKLDYPRYRLFDRLMIRFIMLLTRGPTDPATVVEFTDWQRVDDFGRTISALPAATCAAPADTETAHAAAATDPDRFSKVSLPLRAT
jgi:menaquinone-dependent protoporphyrinogen oxidase